MTDVENALSPTQSDRIANPIGPSGVHFDVNVDLLVSTLRARGFTFALKDNRLRVSPWKVLSLDERALIKEWQDDIKTLVRAGSYETAQVQPTTSRDAGPFPLPVEASTSPPEAALAPTKAACSFCGGRACIGPDDPRFETLHFADPNEVAKRNAEATKVMLAMMNVASPYL